VIFFRESLSLAQLLMIIALFAGILLISVDWGQIRQKDFWEKGSLFALSTALVVSLVNFLVAAGAKNLDPVLVLCLSWIFSGLICGGLIMRRHRGVFFRDSRQHWPLILITMIIDAVAWLCYAWATASQELSITIAISESFLVVAMFLGLVFNKEKISRLQYLGAAIALVCSLSIGFIK
jgi:drug/metabolite transporter (DMT)-like permease